MSTEEAGKSSGHAGSAGNEQAETPLAPFHIRVVQTFFSPGAMAEGVAKHPAWVAALLTGMALVVASLALIPPEIWESFTREQMLARGQEVPPGFEAGIALIRISSVVFGAVGYAIFTFLLAGLATLVFAFLLGDEGRYRQYLAIMAHAWLIPALVGLLLTPLRIAGEDPQLTLNLGSFLFFLQDGYLARVAKMLDLSQLWAWLVVAQGAHAIHPRRSFGSAAAVLLAIFLVIAMLFGLIPGS